MNKELAKVGDTIKKIYLSGKITGTTDYMERFAKAEEELTARGYLVVNPAKINAMLPEGVSYNDYISLSHAELGICDTIYMLKGWQDSNGARIENTWAGELGKTILYEED